MAFAENGFAIHYQFFTSEQIEQLESAILDLYLMQARKIGDYADLVEWVSQDNPTVNKVQGAGLTEITLTRGDRLAELCKAMEGADKEALYQVQKFFPASQACRKIFDDRFMAMCAGLIGTDQLLIDGPAVFVNAPKSDRLLYKWHSEAHYYPGRRRFLNIWFPIFEPKTKHNGAMSLKVGSHTKHYDRPAPYQGYNKNTEGKANHFIQFDIPENFHEEFPEHVCETEPGDLVIFDRNLVHTSNANQTKRHSFACVARVWTPKDDLTLAGHICGPEIGRANLRVAA